MLFIRVDRRLLFDGPGVDEEYKNDHGELETAR
jgi:hypothetical protein